MIFVIKTNYLGRKEKTYETGVFYSPCHAKNKEE